MPSGAKELRHEIEREMVRWPGVKWRIERRVPHWRLHLSVNGRTRFVVMPGSPGCIRGMKNKRTDIRHALRELGVEQ